MYEFVGATRILAGHEIRRIEVPDFPCNPGGQL
jgi:hypothetical protein